MEDKLQYLRDLAQNWKPARDLNSLRDTMVFATGNPHTQLMLIGEAPGYYEEVQREPFVGRAGEKLNQILKAMGLSRDMVYISNIVKFRPSLPNQRTNNRAPTPEEIEACLPIIMHEIQVIQPKMIIALGGTAAVGLLGEQGSVSSMRGRFHDLNGIPVRVTWACQSPKSSAAISCPGNKLPAPFYTCRSQTGRTRRPAPDARQRAERHLQKPWEFHRKTPCAPAFIFPPAPCPSRVP